MVKHMEKNCKSVEKLVQFDRFGGLAEWVKAN